MNALTSSRLIHIRQRVARWNLSTLEDVRQMAFLFVSSICHSRYGFECTTAMLSVRIERRKILFMRGLTGIMESRGVIPPLCSAPIARCMMRRSPYSINAYASTSSSTSMMD